MGTMGAATWRTSHLRRSTGRLAEYEFSSAGLSISTAIFGFVVKDEKPTAFLVVGYFAKANRNEGMEAFNALLRNMVDEKSN